MRETRPAVREVAPGVLALEGATAGRRCAVVLGGRTALAVDGGADAAEGQSAAAVIRARGFEPRRLALTHGHGGHLLGAQALAAGEVYAHARLSAALEQGLPAWAERLGLPPAELRARLPQPTVTFEQEIRLDLGQRRVRLVPTPGHSPDGISAYVEDVRVLIAGDTVVTCRPPTSGEGNSRVLEASLLRLADLGAEVLIPGHGPVLEGAEPVRDWLGWAAGYLARVRKQVRQALVAGATPEEAAEQAGFEAMVGSRLDPGADEARARHRAAALKIASEELVRLP